MPPVIPPPLCSCHLPTVRLISRTAKNPNEPFYKCKLPPPRQCGFFAWEWRLLGMPASYAQAGIPPPPSSPKTPGKEVRALPPAEVPLSSKAAQAAPSTPATPKKAAKAPSAAAKASPKTPVKTPAVAAMAAASGSAPTRKAQTGVKTPASTSKAATPAARRVIGLSKSPAKAVKPHSTPLSKSASKSVAPATTRGELSSAGASPSKSLWLGRGASTTPGKTPAAAVLAREAPDSPSPSQRARVTQTATRGRQTARRSRPFVPMSGRPMSSAASSALVSEDEDDDGDEYPFRAGLFGAEEDRPISPILDFGGRNGGDPSSADPQPKLHWDAAGYLGMGVTFDAARPHVMPNVDSAEAKEQRRRIRRAQREVIVAAVRVECKNMGYATHSDSEDEGDAVHRATMRRKEKGKEREVPATPPSQRSAALPHAAVPPMTPITPAKRRASSPDRSNLTPAMARLADAISSTPYRGGCVNFENRFLEDNALAIAVDQADPTYVMEAATRLIEELVRTVGDKDDEILALKDVERAEPSFPGAFPLEHGLENPFIDGVEVPRDDGQFDHGRGDYDRLYDFEEEKDDDQLEADACARGEDGFVGKWGQWHDLRVYPELEPF